MERKRSRVGMVSSVGFGDEGVGCTFLIKVVECLLDIFSAGIE